MLVYVVTVAASAFFVPHYLSIFWEPLKTKPWDIVGGAIVIVVLVVLNIVGVQEAARLSRRSSCSCPARSSSRGASGRASATALRRRSVSASLAATPW
ncbi:MAG: hypothetical protein H0U19_14050 [Acidobacteria bacterium]|nr:hypothetical protein [Acidobacteriota bacterium]